MKKKKKRKKLKKDIRYFVYEILFNGDRIYVGQTNDMKKRTYQHNYQLKKGKDKELYNFLRNNNIKEITLKDLYCYEKRADAKRREALIILNDYFGANSLMNKIPNISDR